MADLAELNLVINSQQVPQATAKLNDLTAASKVAENGQQNLTKASHGLAAGLRALLPIAAALTAAFAVMKFAIASISEAADFEALESGMSTLLKSTTQAKALLQDLKKFADETPFELKGLADNAKKLLGLRFAANEVVPILRIVGDTASGLDSGTEGMERMIVALGQIQAKGKVSAEEMNQLLDSNVNGWKYLADTIKTDVPTAMKLAEQGLIDGTQGVRAILAGMQKEFGGGMEKAAKLTKGLWSTLMDEIHGFMRELGTTLIEAFNIKGGIQEATEIIRFLGAVAIDVLRAIMNVETRLKSTEWLVKPIADWIHTTYTDIKKGWFSLLDYIEEGWTYLKFGFFTVIDIIKTGALAAAESIRKVLKDLLDSLSASLSAYAQPGLKNRGIMAMLGVSTDDVKGVLDTVNTFRDAISAPIQTDSTLTEFFQRTKESFAEANDEADKIHRLQQKNINTAKDTGLFKDIWNPNTMTAGGGGLLSKIPGMGNLMEFKDAVLKEMADSQKGGGIAQVDPTKVGQILKPSREVLESGLEKLRDMNRDLDQQIKVAGLTNEEADKLNLLNKAQEVAREHFLKYDQNSKAQSEALIARLQAQEVLLERLKQVRQISEEMAGAFSGAFEEFILGAKSAKDVLKDLLKEIERIAVKNLLTKPLEGFLGSLFTGVGSALVNPGGSGQGSLGTSTTETLLAQQTGVKSAKGNAFWLGDLVPFALGGIVGGPTMFPMTSGRTGLMGERGPEAIMPLTRGSDGSLGVKAQVNAPPPKQTIVNFNVTTPNADSFRRSSRQIAQDMKRAVGG